MKRICFLFIACLVLFLSACGQKGPLYLPQPTKNATKSNS
ncbi:LPS translocon maturation chaperone LptM [Legionella sp. WA2022007384]